MSFAGEETSIQAGRPIELIEITVGLTIFRFTSSEREETFDGQTWTPVPLERDQIRMSQDEPGSSVEFLMSAEHPSATSFTRAWITQAPSTGDTRIRLFRHHQDDGLNEFQLFWVGFLVSPSYEEDGAILKIGCRSLDNLFTLQGPRKNWGTLCNHQLFGRECGLTEADFTQQGTVAAIAADGITFTISGIVAPTVTHVSGELRKPGTFTSGLIVAVPVANSQFRVQYPLPEIAVNDIVEIVEGCDHSLTHCQLFPRNDPANFPSNTNVENFGGSPFTPPLNIFTKGGDAL